MTGTENRPRNRDPIKEQLCRRSVPPRRCRTTASAHLAMTRHEDILCTRRGIPPAAHNNTRSNTTHPRTIGTSDRSEVLGMRVTGLPMSQAWRDARDSEEQLAAALRKVAQRGAVNSAGVGSERIEVAAARHAAFDGHTPGRVVPSDRCRNRGGRRFQTSARAPLSRSEHHRPEEPLTAQIGT